MPRKQQELSDTLDKDRPQAKKKPWVDPDDGLEWTEEMFERAEIRHGDKIIRPGRPPLGDKAKGSITIRLDPDVLEAYRALGAGWQTRINADLRKARKLKPIPA